MKESENTVYSTLYAEWASFLCDVWKSKFETHREGPDGAEAVLHGGSPETNVHLPVCLSGKGPGTGSDTVALASLELTL